MRHFQLKLGTNINNMITRLPGLIDPHVHLRTPGQETKEDFLTGTSAALAGGFTAVIDMPNNKVPITTIEKLKEKEELAQQQIVSDIGFHFGTLGDNLSEFDRILEEGRGVKGLKIYLNQTTGNFLLDKKHLAEIFERWPQELPILFHAEDETFDDVLEVLYMHPRKIHLCHMSTAYELKRVMEAKEKGMNVTCGVTPHHLFLSEKHFKDYGAFAMMRPPLMPQSDVDFLWEHLRSVDMIESDHAPHTLAEKESNNPPNGIPGLETTLPLLLTAVSQNAMTLNDVKRLCYEGPSNRFAISQGEDTYVEVDLDEEYVIEQANLFSKAKWTPFNGWKMKGKIKKTILHGATVFENGKIMASSGSGQILS